MSESENNMQTAPAEPKKRTRQTPAEKPARSRRNYQAEHAALEMKVEVARKLLRGKCAANENNDGPNDLIIEAVLDLLS